MNDVFTWPVGRDARRREEPQARPAPPAPVVAYVLGCALSGGAVGALLGLAGTAARDAIGASTSQMLLAGLPIVLVAVLCQWAGRIAPLPERRAQVPRRWLQWQHRTATAAAFGLVIGAGALTYLWHAIAWVLALVLLAAAPGPGIAALCGGLYGATRGFGLVLTFLLDRTERGRPDWDATWMARTPASLALAPAGLLTYLAVLLAA